MFRNFASAAFIVSIVTISPAFAAEHGGGHSSGGGHASAGRSSSGGYNGGSYRGAEVRGFSGGGRSYSAPRYSAPARPYVAPARIYGDHDYRRGPGYAYRGGVVLGFGGGYGYGYNYPYGYAQSYGDAPVVIAPPPCTQPLYDRYGNPIQDSACYASQPQYPPQQEYYGQPQQYDQAPPQYGQQQQYAPQQQYYQNQQAQPYYGR